MERGRQRRARISSYFFHCFSQTHPVDHIYEAFAMRCEQFGLQYVPPFPHLFVFNFTASYPALFFSSYCWFIFLFSNHSLSLLLLSEIAVDILKLMKRSQLALSVLCARYHNPSVSTSQAFFAKVAALCSFSPFLPSLPSSLLFLSSSCSSSLISFSLSLTFLFSFSFSLGWFTSS